MKTKENLLNAIFQEAQKQFFSKGYKNLNIDDLVSTIGISKATFYKYIPSKELLFEECIRRLLNDFKYELSKYIRIILKSKKETFFYYFIEMIKKSGDFLNSITNVINNQVEKRFPQISIKLKDFTKKQIENSFFSIIQKGREIGLIKKGVNDNVLYFIIYFTLTNLKQFTVNQKIDIPLNKFFYEYFSVIFNGILNEDSKQLYFQQIKYFNNEK